MGKTNTISFVNAEEAQIDLQIADTDAGPGGVEVLTGAKPAVVTRTVVDGDERFATIFGKSADIRFINSSNVSARNFSRGADGRFLATLYFNNLASKAFAGNLLMDGLQEPYLPAGHPCNLVAVDNLGLLKEVELSDFSGARPKGLVSLLKIIAWCLSKTGMSHDIIELNNLFHKGMTDRDAEPSASPFQQAYVDVRTFEKDELNYLDCYTVLQMILGSHNMRISQGAGTEVAWWIVRIDELKNPTVSYTRYAGDGETVIEYVIDGQLNKTLRDNSGLNYFIDAKTLVRHQRPYKSVSLKFRYEVPKEVIPNQFLDRGEYQPLIDITICKTIKDTLTGNYVTSWDGLTTFTWGGSSVALCFLNNTIRNNALSQLADPVRYVAEDITAISPSYAYSFDDWTAYKEDGTAGHFSFYVIRTLDALNFEKERYLSLGVPNSNTKGYIQHQPSIRLQNGDIFEFSFDYRWRYNPGGSGGFNLFIAHLRMIGEDGTYWNCDDDGNWHLSNSSWTVNVKRLQESGNLSTDQTEWRNKYVKTTVPVTGELYVGFYALNQLPDLFDNVDIHFKRIEFIYQPIINNVKFEWPASEFKVSQTTNYLNKKELQEIYLGDSPKPLFKGALFYPIWNMSHTAILRYELTTDWYDWALKHAGITGSFNNTSLPPVSGNYGTRFQKWKVFEQWHQYRRESVMLDASLFKMHSATTEPMDLHHVYEINVESAHTKFRKFIIIGGFMQDWFAATWDAQLAEIDSTEDGVLSRKFDDRFDFKYLKS